MDIYGYLGLRDHFQGKLEHAMVPKVGRIAIDVVKNIKAVKKAEEEAFKHAKGACEYFARVALKFPSSGPGRDLGEFIRQVLVYGTSYTLCFVLTTTTWICDYCKHKKGATNIHKAPRLIFIAALIKMADMIVYPTGVIVIIKNLALFDPVEVGNCVLWTYHSSGPSQKTHCERDVSMERVMSENKVFTPKAAQDDYFKKLANDWDDKFNMKDNTRKWHRTKSATLRTLLSIHFLLPLICPLIYLYDFLFYC